MGLRHISEEKNDMRQKLIIISGSPCVGKTSVVEKVFSMLDNSAYLDGDWAWHVNPFSTEDPRLRDGDKNMSFTLTTYLKSQFEYVFFSSVVATDLDIRNNIIADIDYKDYDLIGITLTCSRGTLAERHKSRGDNNEISYYFLDLDPYPGDVVINTDNKSIDDVSREIYSYIIEKKE